MAWKKVSNNDPGTASRFGGDDLDKISDFLSGVSNIDTGDVNSTFNVRGTKFSVKDSTDATKIAKFDPSGITTGTTRTYGLPNATDTLALRGWVSAAFLSAGGASLPASNTPTRSTITGTNHTWTELQYPHPTVSPVTTTAFWNFTVPGLGTSLNMVFKIKWISTNTTASKAVKWQISLLGRIDAEQWDTALTNATTVTTTAPTTSRLMKVSTITINTSGVDAGDSMIVSLARLAADAADTMTTTTANVIGIDVSW